LLVWDRHRLSVPGVLEADFVLRDDEKGHSPRRIISVA
jgi:hypothetical protein